jgi:hypothetical protein
MSRVTPYVDKFIKRSNSTIKNSELHTKRKLGIGKIITGTRFI